MANKTISIFISVCFLLAPLQSLWAQVDPDPETVPPKTIVVNATVGGIVPGPIEPAPAAPSDDDDDDDEDDDDDDKDKKEAPVSFSIFPRGSEEQYQGENYQESTPRIVFNGKPPAFFGTGSVSGGIVSLQFSFGDFRYSASTRLDGAGNWQWESPVPFPNGTYTVVAKLLDPFTFEERARQELQFAQINNGEVNMWQLVPLLEPGQQTTDIIVTPVSGYERVMAGETFKARIHLFGFPQLGTILLEYIILGPDGTVHLRQTENLENRTSESFVKPFFTKDDLVPGKYILLVRAVSETQVALGSAIFYIDESIRSTDQEQLGMGSYQNSRWSFLFGYPALLVVGGFILMMLLNIAFFFILFQGTPFIRLSRIFFILTNIALLLALFFLWRGI